MATEDNKSINDILDKAFKMAMNKEHEYVTLEHLTLIMLENKEIIDFPVVVKPDIGRGSKNIFVCLDQVQVKAALALVENPIIQEYIPSPESEYTCAIYRNLKFKTVCIVFHRYLSGGSTSWAEVVNDNVIKDICVKIDRIFQNRIYQLTF